MPTPRVRARRDVWSRFPYPRLLLAAGAVLLLIGAGQIGAVLRRPNPAHVSSRSPTADRDASDAAQRRASALMAQAQTQGVRVNCAMREVDVPPILWAHLSTTEKRGLTVSAATHCHTSRFVVRDASSARRLASVAAGVVTFD